MDDSSPRRRGDVALCCAYVLQGNDWAPVNNSRPDDLTNESRFLAAKIMQDDDMAEAFLELHDYPQTTIIELVVKLKAESRLVKLGGARNAKAHVYELERCCGPDVVALQFADDRAADNFGRAIRRAASQAAERRASFTDADALIRRCVDAGFEARDVREAVAAGASASRIITRAPKGLLPGPSSTWRRNCSGRATRRRVRPWTGGLLACCSSRRVKVKHHFARLRLVN